MRPRPPGRRPRHGCTVVGPVKCPACKNSHRRKDGPKCSKCERPFVFFDRGAGITDHRFSHLIDRASAAGTQYFTRNQLATQWALAGARAGGMARIVIGSIFGLSGGAVAIGVTPVGAVIAVAGLTLLISGVVARRNPAPPDLSRMQGWIAQWRAAGHEIPLLLGEPGLDRSPPQFREPDVFDYGVERILIVQHDILVDLFVRNNVHATQRALVISERGYPSYLLPVAQRLLATSPDLPIFLLHDADTQGLMMRARLERSGMLPLAGRRIIDAGLTPRDVGRIGKLRALGPKARGNALPADALPFALLAGGFALAFADNVPLTDLIDRKDPDGRASFG